MINVLQIYRVGSIYSGGTPKGFQTDQMLTMSLKTDILHYMTVVCVFWYEGNLLAFEIGKNKFSLARRYCGLR